MKKTLFISAFLMLFGFISNAQNQISSYAKSLAIAYSINEIGGELTLLFNEKSVAQKLEDKTVEFREVTTSGCRKGEARKFDVYVNGERTSKTIFIADYDGNWYDGCPDGVGVWDNQPKSQFTLKEYLIRYYKTHIGSADSFTLTTL